MNCSKCATPMKLSEGWVPTYSNPDNHNLEPSAEPYCPKCEKEYSMKKKAIIFKGIKVPVDYVIGCTCGKISCHGATHEHIYCCKECILDGTNDHILQEYIQHLEQLKMDERINKDRLKEIDKEIIELRKEALDYVSITQVFGLMGRNSEAFKSALHAIKTYQSMDKLSREERTLLKI